MAELHAVTARTATTIVQPWNHIDDSIFTPTDGDSHRLTAMAAELTWWGETLRAGRRARVAGEDPARPRPA